VPSSDTTAPNPSVVLREVIDADLPIFFEHQYDPIANRMAAFPSREREAFMAHWAKILVEPGTLIRTIESDGEVVGNIVSFVKDDLRLVGYWLGREHWGRGIASKSLAAFLEIDTFRPLHAYVAKHNLGSLRVLEKCGFIVGGESKGPGETLDVEVEDFLYLFQ